MGMPARLALLWPLVGIACAMTLAWGRSMSHREIVYGAIFAPIYVVFLTAVFLSEKGSSE